MPLSRTQKIIAGCAAGAVLLGIGGVSIATLVSAGNSTSKPTASASEDSTAKPDPTNTSTPTTPSTPTPSPTDPSDTDDTDTDDSDRNPFIIDLDHIEDGGPGTVTIIAKKPDPVVEPTPPTDNGTDGSDGDNGSDGDGDNGGDPDPEPTTEPTPEPTVEPTPEPTDPTETPVTTLADAEKAYLDRHKTNTYGNDDYVCAPVGYGSQSVSGPTSQALPAPDIGSASLGWTLRVTDNGTRWHVTWYACELKPTTIEQVTADVKVAETAETGSAATYTFTLANSSVRLVEPTWTLVLPTNFTVDTEKLDSAIVVTTADDGTVTLSGSTSLVAKTGTVTVSVPGMFSSAGTAAFLLNPAVALNGSTTATPFTTVTGATLTDGSWVSSTVVSDPPLSTQADAEAAYTERYGASIWTDGATQVGDPVTTPYDVVADMPAGADTWKVSVSADGSEWTVTWYDSEPISTIDDATAAYLERYPGMDKRDGATQVGDPVTTQNGVVADMPAGADAWSVEVPGKGETWVVTFWSNPIVSTQADATAAYTAAHGASTYEEGMTAVGAPQEVEHGTVVDMPDGADTWTVTVPGKGETWVVTFWTADDVPVSTLEDAKQAYLARYGANPAEDNAYTCAAIGSGSSTHGSVLPLPTVPDGSVVGWKLSVVDNGETWKVSWFSCAVESSPEETPDQNSAANIDAFITAYNAEASERGNEPLPRSRFQVPLADDTLCWNVKNDRHTSYMLPRIAPGATNVAYPNAHQDACGSSEVVYQAWGMNQPIDSPYIGNGKTAAEGWAGSPAHADILWESVQVDRPDACLTFSSDLASQESSTGRIDWALSATATWQACGDAQTVSATEID